MHSQAWQFFMVGWMVTDRLGHFAWKYSDPALAATLTTAAEQQIGARVRAVFRSLDAQIARLLEAAGPGTAVAIVSDHGFGPVPAHFFNTNRWLIQRGYLRLLPALHPLRALVGYLPRAAKVHLRVPMDSKHGLVDWPQTMAWADPLESRAAGIYLNREDRYAAGIVAADQWRSLRDRLANELAELRAPGGDRLFSAIHTGETLYRGPATAEAPDLVAILARDYDVPPSFRRDVRASTLIVPNRHVLRDGGHEPEGIYLLWGENIRAAGGLPPQPIEALVPTVLQLFGLPLEDDLDAEPITAALREEFVRAFPPRRGAAAAAPTAPAEYSSEDSAAVEERLRNLGYMD
jgi:predicted AlkP superfamily phosphohydrolase/phosphomutase